MPQMSRVAAAALSPILPDVLFQRGEFARARAGYQARRLYEGELRSLLRLDRWQEAIVVGESAPAPTPEQEGLLSLAYLRAGQPQRARESADWAWRRDPQAYWPLVARGTLALRWDADPVAAGGFLRQATALRPELAEGWLALLAAPLDSQEAARSAANLARLEPRGYPFDFWSKPLRESALNALRFTHAFPDGQVFCPVGARLPVQTLRLKRDPRGMLYFDAEVDGQRMRLLYDTGGGRHFLLTPAAVARLRPLFIASTVVTGLQGQSGGGLHRAERLRLDTLELRALPVESAPANLGGFDGLVGWRVFGERIQRLDLRQNTLTLLERPSVQESGALQLPLHLILDQPVIGVRCRRRDQTAEIPLWAILDTGATEDFFSLRAGAQLTSRFRRGALQASIGIGQSHKRIETRSLAVGFDLLSQASQPLTSYSEATAASFLDTVHNPASGFEHGLLLGMDFISRFTVIELDPVGRQVRLVPQ
ncbi:aspartyl protease family protein [Armatimonas sp.]|uniref:aspartyl protease family protein n=1 Tax=Armatimonas sp. TaxID=1872638 RepID=UPI00374C9312